MSIQELVRRAMPRRLGAQLKWMVLLSLWAIIGLLGAYTLQEQSAVTRSSIESQASALARNIALASVDLILTDKLDMVEALIVHAADFPQVVDIEVIDAHGASVSHVVSAPGRPPRAVFDTTPLRLDVPGDGQPALRAEPGTNRIRAWQPIVAGDVLGWVRVDYDTQALQTIRKRIWQDSLAAGLLAGLSSVLVLNRLLRRPLRAIERARDFAMGLERIEGQQIEQPDGPIETIALGRALNQASARLRDQHLTIEATMGDLHRNKLALAETNEQLQAIFALSPDALVSFDGDGTIKFANAALLRLTGLWPEEVINQPGSVLDDHLRRGAAEPRLYVGLDGCFPSDSGSGVPPLRRQLTLARPRHVVLEMVGILSDAGQVSRLLYLRDVTHESEVDRIKSEFLATAAHELRTPMTGIHSCVELLLMRDFDDERRNRLLNIVQRQSTVMMAVVNDLLDLARIEARRGADFALERLDLAQVLAQAVGDFAPPEGREPPQVEWGPGAAMAPDGSGADEVIADRSKLAQVLHNLLSNAYGFSAGGAVVVRMLAAAAGPAGPRVGFEVEDHGIGMTPDQLARVCERFYRADPSGHVLGTGLGMSIAKEVTELLGGSLALRSVPGQGTTVAVWLPLSLRGRVPPEADEALRPGLFPTRPEAVSAPVPADCSPGR
jgi:two-component system, OmpR family, sensor histidine kinase VicK